MALLGNSAIAIANDDDFGVTDGPGGLAQKVPPATGRVDVNTVYFLKLPKPVTSYR